MDIMITEGYTKAMKVFIDMAKRYGAKLVTSKGKHLKFRDNLGHQISAPKTSSDFRAIRNFQSELKNKGFIDSQTTKKVKDALVNKTNVTAVPVSNTRRTANQQTTFKQFTQRFQPNVQGPRKPNSPVVQKQGPVQGPESELASRHTAAFDKMLDNVIKDVRGRQVPTAKRRTVTRAQLDAMNIPQREKDKLIRQGLVTEGAALALKAGSSLIPKIMTGIGAVGTVLQASKADKERRRQLAKDNNLDITNPRDRATLGRLLKKDTEAKKRAEKGDTRSQEQYRQDKVDNNKAIDATRQQLGQSKAKPGTKERAEIDKKLKDFRDELRDVSSDPIVPSTRARVRVKVGQEVPKPDNTQPPRTGASPQRVRDRRSYEAQQRRNRKLDEENKHRDAKLYGQYKQSQNPPDPREKMVRDALKLLLKKV